MNTPTESARHRLLDGLAVLPPIWVLVAVGHLAAQPVTFQESKLVASDGASGAGFGHRLAIDGNTAVIAAPFADNQAGAVYVFRYGAGEWTQVTKLVASDRALDDLFGFGVAISGGTIVVGAQGDNTANGTDSGSAYVFEEPAGGWGSCGSTTCETAKLIAADGAAFDYMGESVGVSGDVVVVSASDNDDMGTDSGSAYVFRKPYGAWVETAKLTASDGAPLDRFGLSLAISGATIIVGAPQPHGIGTGIAYVFEEPLGGWAGNLTETAKLAASVLAVDDRFGETVALDGSIVVVGASRDDDAGGDAGTAYVFERPACGWSVPVVPETAQLLASDGAGGDEFGLGVAIFGTTVVVGTVNAGAVYVFERLVGGWIETGTLTASDATAADRFGFRVGVGNQGIVAGAPQADGMQAGSGAAYVFSVGQPPSCTADLTVAASQFLQPSAGSFVVTEGEIFEATFVGDDPDGDNLTVVLSGLPGATITPSEGAAPLATMAHWAPHAADKSEAPYLVAVTFSDPAGGSSSCQFTIEDVNLRPVCSAGESLVVECDSQDGALVTLPGDATDPDDAYASLLFHWDVSDMAVTVDDPNTATPSGIFPIGITMATLTVADGRGGVDVCDVPVTVQDTTAPEVMCTTDMASLWPPNHEMREVMIAVAATDECSSPEFIFPLVVTVRSNEPDDAVGAGDGATSGDVDGQAGFESAVDVTSRLCWDPMDLRYTGSIQLRAERAGSGVGRCYTIDVVALDSHGNAATTSCCVVVPHDRRNGV